MFIGITTDRENGGYLWEVMNGAYERVDHGCAPTKAEAQECAEKAKEAYLYWLKYYKYRGF